jgi:hypothetical protein
MITGALEGGSLYNRTSVPQIPATAIFSSAQSGRMSGMGNSRISVLLGATLTAASTLSTVRFLPFEIPVRGQSSIRSGLAKFVARET